MARLVFVLVVLLFLLVFKVMEEVGGTNERLEKVVEQHIDLSRVLDLYQKAYWCEHKHGPADACKAPVKETTESGGSFR
jgi:hypothetical protein